MAAPVSSSFCVPHETQLVVKPKSWFGSIQYSIKDENGVLLFTMKSETGLFSQPKRRIYDATSGKVLLLIKKERKWFGRPSWMAFHGDSESESELFFTMRKKGSFSKSDQVFLLNNDSSSPDYFVKTKSWSSISFIILSNGRPIAEAKRIGCASSSYSITVYPEVDRSFIAALAILWILQRSEETAALVIAASS